MRYIPGMLLATPDPARPVLAILLMSLGALAAALTGQYVFGLEPCVLCLWQRLPFALTAVLAAVALPPRWAEGRRPHAIGIAALIFAAGPGLAFYPWACSSTGGSRLPAAVVRGQRPEHRGSVAGGAGASAEAVRRRRLAVPRAVAGRLEYRNLDRAGSWLPLLP
ncbi:MAG: disulfide bond formation protein B [Rhodospirillales bacterium]